MRKPLKIMKRFRNANKGTITQRTAERLVSCAIIRNGATYHGQRSHAQIRGMLGDQEPYAEWEAVRVGDQEGFWTSKDRFVTRDEGLDIAIAAGQVHDGFSRKLLSSDVRW